MKVTETILGVPRTSGNSLHAGQKAGALNARTRSIHRVSGICVNRVLRHTLLAASTLTSYCPDEGRRIPGGFAMFL